jgi:hypothetical protein
MSAKVNRIDVPLLRKVRDQGEEILPVPAQTMDEKQRRPVWRSLRVVQSAGAVDESLLFELGRLLRTEHEL